MIVYLAALSFWLCLFLLQSQLNLINFIDEFFYSGISLISAVFSAIYGVRLWLLFKQNPIDTVSRRSKMTEVAIITTVVVIEFVARAALWLLNDFFRESTMSWLIALSIYFGTDFVPCCALFWAFRRLPRPRIPEGEALVQ